MAFDITRTGVLRARPAFQARRVGAAADLDVASWWADVPRVQLRAISGDPRHRVRWIASSESALRFGRVAAGGRLARLAIDVHVGAGDRWEGIAGLADELRAPNTSALRPSTRLVATLEVAGTTRGPARDPWRGRLEVRSTRHAEPLSESPRLLALVRGQPRDGGPVFAASAVCGDGVAWCAGWRVLCPAGGRRVAALHAIAHGAVRRATAPAWPLTPTVAALRGDGLDFVAELRDDDDGGVALGRAVSPRGRPRWWCRVRLGWPRRA